MQIPALRRGETNPAFSYRHKRVNSINIESNLLRSFLHLPSDHICNLPCHTYNLTPEVSLSIKSNPSQQIKPASTPPAPSPNTSFNSLFYLAIDKLLKRQNPVSLEPQPHHRPPTAISKPKPQAPFPHHSHPSLI